LVEGGWEWLNCFNHPKKQGLKSEKVDLDIKHLILLDDLSKVKETLNLKEVFVSDFVKLEKESVELKQKVESLLEENNKLKQVEADFSTNRSWNQASQAMN